MPPQHLLLIINSLSGGGAERVVVRLLETIAHEYAHLDVHIALLAPQIEYALPPSVTVHILCDQTNRARGTIRRQFSINRRLRQLMRQIEPAAALSLLPASNLHLIVAKMWWRGGRVRTIISERASINETFRGFKGIVARALYRVLYPRADRIICVAEGIVGELAAIGVPREKCLAIYSGVAGDVLRDKAAASAPRFVRTAGNDMPFFITVGRLAAQKGHDVAIEAVGLLRERGCALRLVIYGKGELEAETRRRIAAAGLHAEIVLAGFDANPFPDVAAAAGFILPSRFEGFPVALLEAMALGAPVVAADCRFGPREMIGESRYGQLIPVDDARALADAMESLIMAFRSGTLEQHRKRSLEGAARFDVQAMTQRYLDVLLG